MGVLYRDLNIIPNLSKRVYETNGLILASDVINRTKVSVIRPTNRNCDESFLMDYQNGEIETPIRVLIGADSSLPIREHYRNKSIFLTRQVALAESKRGQLPPVQLPPLLANESLSAD